MHVPRRNFVLHVLGGQQLTWPPYPQQEESTTQAEEEPVGVKGDEAVSELYMHEMGFALVVEAMIKSGKPLIGHNCMYDWLYTYN